MQERQYLTREHALKDAKNRYAKIKDRIQIIFREDKFGFKYEDFRDLSMNEYGRMCELGYLVSTFRFTKEELGV